MKFWETVKYEIKKQQLKQEWVAAQAGVNYGTMKGWITHDRLPNVEDAHNIARVLGVTVEYLLIGEDTRNTQVINEIRTYLDKIDTKLNEM